MGLLGTMGCPSKSALFSLVYLQERRSPGSRVATPRTPQAAPPAQHLAQRVWGLNIESGYWLNSCLKTPPKIFWLASLAADGGNKLTKCENQSAIILLAEINLQNVKINQQSSYLHLID
jgi:hypothetical protein